MMALLLCVMIFLFFMKFYRPLFYIAFDKEYSRTHYIALSSIEIGITALIALCIVLCMKLAGIILVISYLTMPQAIGGMFYKNFKQQLILSTLISCLGSVVGLFLSVFLESLPGRYCPLLFSSFFCSAI